MGRVLVVMASILLLAGGCWHRRAYVAAPLDGPLPQSVDPYSNSAAGPDGSAGPIVMPGAGPPVPRINATLDGNQPWPMTFGEALNISMRNSSVVRTLNGGTVSAAGTSFDPAVNAAQAKAALAIFDPVFQTSVYANWISQPSGEIFGPGIPEQVRRNEAGVLASLTKPLQTGGNVRVAYNPPDAFVYFPNGTPGFINPINNANTEFSVTQSLLRGFGTAFNRAPIRIAQIQTDQSTWDLKAAVMGSVRSVTQAYWELQAAYVSLKAIEDVLPLIEEVLRVEQANFEAQRSIRADVVKAQAQLYQYRQQRLAAKSNILARELALRNLLGLEPADGRNIVPAAEPTRAPIKVDPTATMQIATTNRPDLIRQRLNIRIRELQLMMANNGMKPQLDVNALYRMNGLGNTVESAWKQMVTNEFNDWQVAAVFSMPLGRRMAKANARGATIQLEREQALLRQAMHQAAYQLSDVLRQLEYLQQQYIEADARVRNAEEWLQGSRIRYQNPPPGIEGQNWLLQALNDYLMALRFKADAAVDAATLLAAYNTQLARLEEATGTLLATNDIQLANDPCEQVNSTALFPCRIRNIDPGCSGYFSDLAMPSALSPQSLSKAPVTAPYNQLPPNPQPTPEQVPNPAPVGVPPPPVEPDRTTRKSTAPVLW